MGDAADDTFNAVFDHAAEVQIARDNGAQKCPDCTGCDDDCPKCNGFGWIDEHGRPCEL